jgi:hypothetical protein
LRLDLSNVSIKTKVRRFLIRFLALHFLSLVLALVGAWLVSDISRSLELTRWIFCADLSHSLGLLFALRLSGSEWNFTAFILHLTANSQRLTLRHLRLLLLLSYLGILFLLL